MTLALAAVKGNSADAAILLLLCGILLLYAEFNRPGTILLGAAGMLVLMLGIAQLLPLNFSPVGVALNVDGILMLLFEIRFPPRGLHRVGVGLATGTVILGLRSLVAHQAPGAHASTPEVHWPVAIFAGAIFCAVTFTLGRIALLATRNKRLPSARSGI